MFQRIIVPLDGATRAEKAIPLAARLARISGGSIVLLQVISTPGYTGGFMYEPVVFTQADIDTEISKATKYLTAISLSDELEGVGVHTLVLVGAVAPSILSAIQTNAIDLVVMSSHGETGLTHWVMGSVAQKIVRHSPVPVLVLRDKGPTLCEAMPTAPHALVSLDGSHLAEAAIKPAAQLVSALAAPGRGTLHLVRIVTSPPGYERMQAFSEASLHIHTLEHEKQEAHVYLKDLSASLLKDHANLDITWSVVFESDVASTLVRLAEHNDELRGIQDCQFIAMATHGRSGLQRWALGSITERTLTATRLPVLIVRPPEATIVSHAEKELISVS